MIPEDKGFRVFISKAPDDQEEKRKWVKEMTRIQIAVWITGGATCAHCGHRYTSVDDFIRCSPRSANEKKLEFVCSACWNEYEKSITEKIQDGLK